jgi:hypothetical protein
MVVWSAGVGEEDDAFVLRADLPDPAMDPAAWSPFPAGRRSGLRAEGGGVLFSTTAPTPHVQWPVRVSGPLPCPRQAHGHRSRVVLEVLEISVAQSLPVVPSFGEQARRHATSERTLRRRLADCGTT